MTITERLWAALGGDPARTRDVEVVGGGRYLPSAFDVDGLAVGAVSCALLAAAELAEARGAHRPRIEVDARHVACAFASERHLRRAGASLGPGFAPLSRFAATRDGWIRLHANYDHHRRALLSALETDADHALEAIAQRDAVELETAIVAAGGAAAAVRTPEEWRALPQGRPQPLVETGPAEPTSSRPQGPPPPCLPAAGLRVVDLTRVIAGPVATRFLAALGADVLRVDPPHMPELELAVLDGCPGKRLAALDLRRDTDAATLAELLAGADALVQGYRPGALARLGLAAPVTATLSAWGRTGPWSTRRGFDSLVQAACGIATAEGEDGVPGALPVQAIDHATGYLLAAGVLRGLAARERGEPGRTVSLALAATAAELMRHPAGGEATAPTCEPFRLELGELSVIAPPGSLDGRPLRWEHGPRPDAPRWG